MGQTYFPPGARPSRPYAGEQIEPAVVTGWELDPATGECLISFKWRRVLTSAHLLAVVQGNKLATPSESKMLDSLLQGFGDELKSLATTALTNLLNKDTTLPASVKSLILASPQALEDLAMALLNKYAGKL